MRLFLTYAIAGAALIGSAGVALADTVSERVPIIRIPGGTINIPPPSSPR